MSSKTNKAIFLDRDGIINVDHGYVYKKEDFEFTDGIFTTLLSLQEKNYKLIIVTNQSGIARGYYSEEDYRTLTTYIVDTFKEHGITISAVFHCPHGPDDGCTCRKPSAGMLLAGKEMFDISMKDSWMIGDKASDILAAKNAGVQKTIFVSTKEKSELASFSVGSITEIDRLID